MKVAAPVVNNGLRIAKMPDILHTSLFLISAVECLKL